MEAAAIIAIIQGATQILQVLEPEILAALQKGELSVEHQAIMKAALNAIRSPDAFVGPEFEVSINHKS